MDQLKVTHVWGAFGALFEGLQKDLPNLPPAATLFFSRISVSNFNLNSFSASLRDRNSVQTYIEILTRFMRLVVLALYCQCFRYFWALLDDESPYIEVLWFFSLVMLIKYCSKAHILHTLRNGPLLRWIRHLNNLMKPPIGDQLTLGEPFHFHPESFSPFSLFSP